MRGLEMFANKVAAGCMHAKFPGLEPRRGQRFLTEETALADWSRVIADNGFHRSSALLTCDQRCKSGSWKSFLTLPPGQMHNAAPAEYVGHAALGLRTKALKFPSADWLPQRRLIRKG